MDTHPREREINTLGQAFALARHPVCHFQAYVVDHPDEGMFTIDRALFTDLELFALEMKNIFERTWIYSA